jgi:hypothetical protein
MKHFINIVICISKVNGLGRATRSAGSCTRGRGGVAAGEREAREGEAQGAGGGARLGGRRQRRRLLCKETGAARSGAASPSSWALSGPVRVRLVSFFFFFSISFSNSKYSFE